MMQCATAAIYVVMHVYCTYSSYSHSFTCVCRDANPVDSRLVVSLGHLAVKSRRVSSRRSLGQNVGQRRKLFDHRRPAVSFLSREHKQAGLQVADILAEGVNSLFRPLFTHSEEGIIASGFIPARFRRSEVVCCDHDWKNRCWELGIESRCALFQIFLKERFQLFKRNDVYLIVKVGVVGTGDNEQFLVVPSQFAVRGFAEIA